MLVPWLPWRCFGSGLRCRPCPWLCVGVSLLTSHSEAGQISSPHKILPKCLTDFFEVVG